VHAEPLDGEIHDRVAVSDPQGHVIERLWLHRASIATTPMSTT
jgi:hypothetical protein